MCGEEYFAISISDLWAVSVLYGLYVALFGGSIYVLVYRRPNVYHLSTSVTLFLLTTAYIGLYLAQVLGSPIVISNSSIILNGIISPCGSGTSGRLHEALTDDLFGALIGIIFTFMSLVADGVLIYRCVVLWSQRLGRWIGVLLGTLLLANTAMGISASYYTMQVYFLERQQTLLSEEALPPPKWIQVTNNEDISSTADNCLELAVNVISTILIGKPTPRYRMITCQNTYMLGYSLTYLVHDPPVREDISIESGSLISASQLVLICTSFNAKLVAYNVIAPTLIIVRVGLGQGFDSVVETTHQQRACQGIRETQVRSIRFAEHRTTTTDGTHLASLRAIVPAAGPDPGGDAHSADHGSERSNALGQAEGAKAEKVEVGLNVV
ncbi:hypothetical protein EVG20_g10508 [Dentipellis fragilis]|uniref:Uncharacterized protein n=1 Tax=Dentipellis fragilis TaxID=205917 RepID=A0A4Y9XR36_9AGAM|nr:hypothetical protein EVG20_g10508 [Dentipellis fragilis]